MVSKVMHNPQNTYQSMHPAQVVPDECTTCVQLLSTSGLVVMESSAVVAEPVQ